MNPRVITSFILGALAALIAGILAVIRYGSS